MKPDPQLVANHVLFIQQLALRAQDGGEVARELTAAIEAARNALLSDEAEGRSGGNLEAFSRRLWIMASLVDEAQANYKAVLLGAANRI